MKLLFLLLPAFLPGVPALPAQTLLLVVQETLNGSALSAPLAAGEGLAAALFDDGIVVMDMPGTAPAPADSLLRTAEAAGADYLLEIRVDYVTKGTLAAHAEFTLRVVPGGTVALQGSLDETNKDHDGAVDRPALGKSVGGLVAERIWKRLFGSAP